MMRQPQGPRPARLIRALGVLVTLVLMTGCDLLFIPQIFPPQMDLVAPSDTLWLRSGRDTLHLEFRIRDEDGDLGRDTLDQTKDLWMLEVRYGSPAFDSTYTEYVIPNLTQGCGQTFGCLLESTGRAVDPAIRPGRRFFAVLCGPAGQGREFLPGHCIASDLFTSLKPLDSGLARKLEENRCYRFPMPLDCPGFDSSCSCPKW
ncbi:MAG: hypothetical protein ACKO9W_09790, partial [Bacteroidota bacterium]